MRPIQVTFDENLLRELDATEEVRRYGRSAVLRRAVVEYLRRRSRLPIAEGYDRAYGSGDGLVREFKGRKDERRWPEE